MRWRRRLRYPHGSAAMPAQPITVALGAPAEIPAAAIGTPARRNLRALLANDVGGDGLGRGFLKYREGP